MEEALLGIVPEEGASIENKAIREKLNWDEDTCIAVRARLIEGGKLVLGRGRGGSVRRVLEQVNTLPFPDRSTSTSSSGVSGSAFDGELALYLPMIEVLRTRWAKEQPFDKILVEGPSQGGRRRDGIWARPDITLLAMTTYTYVPGRHFEVTTFEVKHYKGLNVTAVYEALAHRRSATRS